MRWSSGELVGLDSQQFYHSEISSIPVAIFEPRDADVQFTTSVPFTYNIDYAPTHIGNEEYLRKIADAPPVLLHVGHDVPFKSMYGPADLYDALGHRTLSPAEARTRIRRIRDYVERLHSAGATVVIPYICSMFLFGNRERRRGFWEFYDNWERYSEFGFGSKPRKDPISWVYGKRRPLRSMDPGSDEYVYEPCINQPEWRKFLRTVVGQVAKAGYDGVFSDVNASSCERPCCRKLFAEYLAGHYTGEEIRKLFGFDGPADIRMGRRGDGLLWVETVRFRGERMASLFAEFRNEGRKHRDTFIVLPNLSPFQHVDGVWTRVGNTHVFSSWARECPVIMFEEMNQPGLFEPGAVSNFVFQYKYAFAHNARAGCLLYGASDSAGVSIAIAEAASGGGGAFIQGGYSCPEVRRAYREFFAEHGGLFEGFVPYSRIGLVFSYDQLAWGTRSHMEGTYRIAEELMANHVLFDILVERDLREETLRGYDAVIAADLANTSEPQARAMMGFVEAGGTLLALGKTGTSDERGKTRRGGIPGMIPESEWELDGPVERGRYGEGTCLRASSVDDLLSPAPFELFMLSEEECNEIDRIFKLIQKSEETGEGRRREMVPEIRGMTGEPGISDCEWTLRFNAYIRNGGEESHLILHAVNYNLPIRGMGESGPVVPAEGVRVTLPLPGGLEPRAVEIYNPPGIEGSAAGFRHRSGNLLFELPRVDIHSLADIHLSRG